MLQLVSSASVFKFKWNIFWILWSREHYLDNKNSYYRGDVNTTACCAPIKCKLEAVVTMHLSKPAITVSTTCSSILLTLIAMSLPGSSNVEMNRLDSHRRPQIGLFGSYEFSSESDSNTESPGVAIMLHALLGTSLMYWFNDVTLSGIPSEQLPCRTKSQIRAVRSNYTSS